MCLFLGILNQGGDVGLLGQLDGLGAGVLGEGLLAVGAGRGVMELEHLAAHAARLGVAPEVPLAAVLADPSLAA